MNAPEQKAYKWRRWDRLKPEERDPRGKWFAGKPTISERLTSKINVDKSTGCWIWTGGKNPNGYGQIRIGGKKGRSFLVHRFLYEMKHGPILGDMSLCHHCDNPPCVNPSHMFVGTHADNMADMVAKGRRPHLLGVETSNAKLSEQDVYEIRAIKGQTLRAIAKQYGVTHPHVLKIRRGELWGHLLPKKEGVQ